MNEEMVWVVIDRDNIMLKETARTEKMDSIMEYTKSRKRKWMDAVRVDNVKCIEVKKSELV